MTTEEAFEQGFKYGFQSGLELGCIIHGCLYGYPNGPARDRCVICGKGRPEPHFFHSILAPVPLDDILPKGKGLSP